MVWLQIDLKLMQFLFIQILSLLFESVLLECIDWVGQMFRSKRRFQNLESRFLKYGVSFRANFFAAVYELGRLYGEQSLASPRLTDKICKYAPSTQFTFPTFSP